MLSSYDEGGLYEECMNRGAYGYLTKDWGSYAKFRTDESEEEWFRGWQRAIEVPLNYKPFFQDTRLLRALGVVSDSGVESLRTALKDVELPTIESTQTLATFFEEFVNGYLYYREEVPQQSLSDCLQNEVFQGGGLPTGQILRILRNNVVHAPSFMNPEVDTWLYLLLLRAFMLRLLRPASVESTSWMDVLRDKLADELADSKALSREEAVYDGTFFSNSDGDLSDINESFIDERNKRIDHLVTRRELSADEFRYHVDGLINCLAAIFPRADLRQNLHELGNLPEDKVDKTLKEICKRSQTNGRYKRGFERLAPIDWVLDANLRATLFDSTGEKYEATLRWALAVRCWLWYFDRLLADSNSLLFESTVEEGQTRGIVENDVYANPDGRLINLFQEQGQAQYISYYGLRIGLYKISKCILERKGAIEDEVSDIRTRRENIQSSLQTLQSDLSSKQSRMSAIQSDLSDLDGRIQKRSANFKGGRDTGKMLQELRERKQGLVDDKEPLKEDIEDLEENISELEPELESVMRRENERRDVLQNIEDQGTNPEIFPDQTEALERSIRRKMTSMATLDVFQNVDDSFDTNTWIESVHEADSHAEVRRCIKRLEAVLP
jgi:prefoldin subunit 5